MGIAKKQKQTQENLILEMEKIQFKMAHQKVLANMKWNFPLNRRPLPFSKAQ